MLKSLLYKLGINFVSRKNILVMAAFVRLVIVCLEDGVVTKEELKKMKAKAYDILLDLGFDKEEFDKIEPMKKEEL